ncbi:MAG TPA: hypothetical protein VKW77_06975 [Acidimicrobiales bacterium]|nr:hypothetical protein [Acidimicrobiales bacterium]
MPEADDADRLEQEEEAAEVPTPPRGVSDPWSPDADVVEQAAPVVAESVERVPDDERIEPVDDDGYYSEGSG